MAYTQEYLNVSLINAGFLNELRTIKYWLTSPELKNHAQINVDDRFLGSVCANGDMKTLKYVLTSPELKEHADIHLGSERALRCAIHKCDIPLVKYLLTSPELKDHANLYAGSRDNNEVVFQSIFLIKNLDITSKVIDYFTLEYAVEKKDAKVYRKLIKHSNNESCTEQIKNNLMANIVNERDETHKKALSELLEDLDPEKYKKFILKENLEKNLEITESNQHNKPKV